MKKLLALLLLLWAGPALAQVQRPISSLPPITTPDDGDALIIDHLASPNGQKTSQITAHDFANYIFGKQPVPPNSLTVGTVTGLASGATPTVTITGTSPGQIINLGLPAGPTGAAGPAGPSAPLSIGTITTLSAGSNATASITGSVPNQQLNLGLPQGASGAGSGNVNTSGTVTDGAITVYNGTTGNSIKAGTLSGIGALAKASNLSDVTSAATALSNLGGAPLASPALTGTPTAPTASAGTNTTQIATTAFVLANTSAGFPVTGILAKSANYTIVSGDKGKLVDITGSITLTLPAASNGTSSNPVYVYFRKRDGSGVATVTAAGSDTFVSGATSAKLYQEEAGWMSYGGAWYAIPGTRQRGWIDVGTTTISSPVSSVSFTTGFGDPDISKVAFELQDVTHSTSTTLFARLAKGGSVLSTTTYRSVIGYSNGTTGGLNYAATTAAASIPLTQASAGEVSGEVVINNPNATSASSLVATIDFKTLAAGTTTYFNTGTGNEKTAGAISTFAFIPTAGTLTAGAIRERVFRQ